MKYLAIVLLFSHLYGVNPATSYCIIQTESSYVHIKGDGGFAHGFGMMHTAAIKDTCKYLNLNCKNIRAIKRRMQRDNRFAIRMSIAYYKTLLDYFKGNETFAIMAYQAGPGSIDTGLYNWTYFAKVMSCENDLVAMSDKE